MYNNDYKDVGFKKFRIFYYLLFIFFTIKSYIVPWTFFKSSSSNMGFYDLGIISDFLSNTAKGKIFFIDDLNISHLSIHWSPTLFLFTPFYQIFNSQFLTVFLGNTCCCLSVIYFLIFILKNTSQIFKENLIYNDKFQYVFLNTIFIFMFFSNKYINANLIGGHFEIVGFSFILLTLTLILENKNFFVILISLLLALCVRQDVGFFLFLNLFSLLFIPDNIIFINKKTKIYIFIFMLISIVYVLLTIKFFLPFMGSTSNGIGLWQEWGKSWSEIIYSMLKQPVKVLNKFFFQSGFTNLNETFFYLGIFNPIQWLLTHLAAIFYYLSNQDEKRLLFWYNSSFVLGGVYISTYVGFIKIFLLLKKLDYSKIYIYMLFTLLISIITYKINRVINYEDYKFQHKDNYKIFKNAYLILVERCRNYNKVSTDIINYSFLPNNVEKYTLKNWNKANGIIFSYLSKDYYRKTGEYEESLIFLQKIEESKERELIYNKNGFKIFCKMK